MNISRTKFIFSFLAFAFVFMFLSNTLFGTGGGVFPQPPEPFLGNEPSVAWKSAGYNILLPLKMVLVGPMLYFDNFLRDDPPPPFVVAAFAFCWSILASILHYLLGKNKAH